MNLLLDIFNKLLGIVKQIGIIILYIIITLAIQSMFLIPSSSNNLFIATSSSILAELIILIIFIFIFKKILIPDFYEFKKKAKKYLKDTRIYWFLGLLVMIISNLLISNFIGMAKNEELNQSVLIVMPVYASIAMVFIAPIVEELMTRVVLKNHFGKFSYCLLSGLFFGGLHLLSITSKIELLYIIPYGALGFAFAYMYNKTNNIWTSITFHSIHNLIALVLFFIGV